MKKILIAIMLLGCTLMYLQQQPFGERTAQAETETPMATQEAAPAAAPVESAPAAAPIEPVPQAQTPAPAPDPQAEAKPAPPQAPMKEEKASSRAESSQKLSHEDFAKMDLKDCSVCHVAEGVAPNHDADFSRGHSILSSKAGNNCAQCHQQAWCLDCHQGGGDGSKLSRDNFGRDYLPKSHRSDFISIHPIKALDNPQTCNKCHETKFCNECHSRFPMGTLRIKSHMMLGLNGQKYTAVFGEHATEARRNLQSCAACHPEGDVCIQCHSSGKVRPHPRSWKAANFKDRTNEKICLKCHLPGTY